MKYKYKDNVFTVHAKRYAENSWHEYKLQKHWGVADELASEGMMEKKTECGVQNAEYEVRVRIPFLCIRQFVFVRFRLHLFHVWWHKVFFSRLPVQSDCNLTDRI